MSLFFAILVNLVFVGLLVAAFWLKPRWLFITLAIIATVLMIIFFGWWYLLWAGLLAAVLFLTLRSLSRFWIIVVGILGVIIAVGGFILTLPLLRGEARNPIAINPFVGNTVAGNPTAPQIAKNCTEAEVVESQTHGDKVLVDLNDGDPFDYSLTVVNPDFPAGNKTLVVLAEPMYIFDVVYPKMYFTSFRLRGTEDQALCSAQKLAGANAYAYIYVGKEATPKGWSTVATKGWWTELVAKQYSEQPITPGGTWAAFQVEANNKTNTVRAKSQLVYGQMWNPNEPGVVVHFQIEKGYEFTIPAGWQGTYWTVVDADPVLVQDRFVQASKEVVERDALIITGNDVTLFYCGATTPTTELKIMAYSLKWTTDLDYLDKYTFSKWECEVTK